MSDRESPFLSPCTCFNSPDKIEPKCPVHGTSSSPFVYVVLRTRWNDTQAIAAYADEQKAHEKVLAMRELAADKRRAESAWDYVYECVPFEEVA